MNTKNLLKFAEFLEGYKGEFDLDDWNLMSSLLKKCGFERKDGENWFNFSERIFGFSWNSGEWYWCLNPHWHWRNIDNSAIGCAARIRILIDKGCPKNWREQMLGKEPLSYNLEDLKLIKEIEKVLK